MKRSTFAAAYTSHLPGPAAYLRATVALLRAAVGLFGFGLRRPGQRARLCRRTGRVRPA